MELKEAINKRKSIRSFEYKKVPKRILRNLIAAGIKAPSSGNTQPWKFYIVTSKKIRDEISKIMAQALDLYKSDLNKLSKKLKIISTEFYSNMGNCPNLIFVYCKKDKEKKDRNIMGISCAVQNIMLSAIEEGLGTCWVGSFRGFEKALNKLLKIPKNEELISSILIGYPKKGFIPLKRKKKSLNQILKFV
jgi:nitroreductase